MLLDSPWRGAGPCRRAAAESGSSVRLRGGPQAPCPSSSCPCPSSPPSPCPSSAPSPLLHLNCCFRQKSYWLHASWNTSWPFHCPSHPWSSCACPPAASCVLVQCVWRLWIQFVASDFYGFRLGFGAFSWVLFLYPSSHFHFQSSFYFFSVSHHVSCCYPLFHPLGYAWNGYHYVFHVLGWFHGSPLSFCCCRFSSFLPSCPSFGMNHLP